MEFSDVVYVFGLVAFIALAFTLFSLVLKNPCFRADAYIRLHLVFFFLILAAFPLTLASLQEVRNFGFNGLAKEVSMGLSGFLLLVYIVLPNTLLQISRFYKKILTVPEGSDPELDMCFNPQELKLHATLPHRFAILYQTFHNKRVGHLIYNSMFLFRRLIAATVLELGIGLPVLQMFVLICLSGAWLAYIGFMQPFRVKVHSVLERASEIIHLLILFSVSSLYFMGDRTKTTEVMAQVIISEVFLLNAVLLIVGLGAMLNAVGVMVKKRKK